MLPPSVNLREGSRQGLSRFSTGKETQGLTIFRTKYQQPLFTPPPHTHSMLNT